MVSNQKLFSVGNFDFRLQHLLVIGVLALSVSISMIIRSGPTAYGFELFEFDPFFNYRATEYILENGTDAYFNWIDEKSWHPFGRNVSETSQVTLHLTAKASSGETALFLVDLTYAGLVTPESTDSDEINSLIMIDAPRLLFPFARAIISGATRDGGFMPLNIQPVDFVAVYQHNLAQQSAAPTTN